MRARRKIVLYNPKAVFFTLPLSLLAVGSALDRQRYEVVIVDCRPDLLVVWGGWHASLFPKTLEEWVLFDFIGLPSLWPSPKLS